MRYFIGLLSLVALVLLVLFLILRGLGGGGEPKDQVNLSDYTHTDTVMRLTIDGPINAEQDHRSVRITVGREETQIDILHGYNLDVAATYRFANTDEGYATFLRALQLLGYTQGNDDEKMADERGYCAKGIRYIFEAKEGNRNILRYWRTSCKEGNFQGEATDIIRLFQDQIPEYRTLTKDVRL